MQPNPVCWFEIYVQDMQRAKTFYEAVFQTTLEKLPPPPAPEGQEECLDSNMEMWTFPSSMEHYGAGGALIKMKGMSSSPGGTLVYFSCEDCAVEAARVDENGGSIFRQKMSIGDYGFIAIGNDPEGNMIGLHSMK